MTPFSIDPNEEKQTPVKWKPTRPAPPIPSNKPRIDKSKFRKPVVSPYAVSQVNTHTEGNV